MKQIYLDNAGSTKVYEDVLDSFSKVCDSYYANASASHDLGNYNNNIFREARKQIASLCVVKEEEIIFTSGASESINTALKGASFYNMHRLRHIVTTSLEHPATNSTLAYLEERFGFRVTYVKPIDGKITAQMIMDEICEDTLMVSMIHVQSETGLVLPVMEVGQLLKDSKVLLHVDACQSFGKIDLDFTNLDLVSISFHKLHGLKGSGMLVKKSDVQIDSLIHGGNQQTYRSGTIPLELVVAAVKTLKLTLEEKARKFETVSAVWNYLYEELSAIDNVVINSQVGNSPYIFNFSILDINTPALSRMLWEKGIYVATNTSCASSKEYSNTILELTNRMDLAKSSLRVSFSKYTTLEDAKVFVEFLKRKIDKVRRNACG